MPSLTPAPPALAAPFVWQVRVYYEDTDAAGVVYYANYLRFCERARTEALRSLGCEQRTLMLEHGLGFVVKSVAVDYLKPARLDDALVVRSHIVQLGGASLTFAQSILRGAELLLTSRIIIACIDLARQRPASLPPELRSTLKALVQT